STATDCWPIKDSSIEQPWRSFSGSLANLVLDFGGNADLLADLLQRTHYQNISLQVTRLETDRILLNATISQ
ncbi:MAG: hypothetical protein P9F75_16525, partial [Candidatus Contendobacter sp.]|nr:hypothetical protein [Candidatus Contendobacter sp.]